LKRAEIALQQQKKFLDSIIENIPNMLFVKEAESLKYIRLNKAGEKLLSRNRAEVIGKVDRDIFSAEQADLFTDNDRKALASKQVLDVPRVQVGNKETGNRIFHTRKIGLYDEADKPAFLLGIAEDITAQLETEDQLRQAQKMEVVGHLTGGVAHDFNNMLGVMLGNAEIALDRLDDGDKARAPVERVVDAITRAAA
jgi:PAS domain S-box-containing protein